MSEPWRRHDLLLVEPRAWSGVLAAHPHLAAIPEVLQWAARGWPLIVRRHLPGDDPTLIPVGLPLPPVNGKLRLAAELSPGEVREWLPAVTLRRLRGETPVSWRGTVDALLGLADETGVEPRVFGSLLWQHATGLPYLSAGSDLDLLWPTADADTAAQLVRGLAGIERNSPVGCDGEILLPDGGGVQWREWHGSPAEVLVKTSAGVRLCATRDVFPRAGCAIPPLR